MYVTARDLEKSFNFNNTYSESCKPRVHFDSCIKYRSWHALYFPSYRYLKMFFKNDKMTFKLTQGHLCHWTGYILFPSVLHSIVTVCLVCLVAFTVVQQFLNKSRTNEFEHLCVLLVLSLLLRARFVCDGELLVSIETTIDYISLHTLFYCFLVSAHCAAYRSRHTTLL